MESEPRLSLGKTLFWLPCWVINFWMPECDDVSRWLLLSCRLQDVLPHCDGRSLGRMAIVCGLFPKPALLLFESPDKLRGQASHSLL